jgi:hypothetical protein
MYSHESEEDHLTHPDEVIAGEWWFGGIRLLFELRDSDQCGRSVSFVVPCDVWGLAVL